MGDLRGGVWKHLNTFKNTLCVIFFFLTKCLVFGLAFSISLGHMSFASVEHSQLLPLTLAETL